MQWVGPMTTITLVKLTQTHQTIDAQHVVACANVERSMCARLALAIAALLLASMVTACASPSASSAGDEPTDVAVTDVQPDAGASPVDSSSSVDSAAFVDTNTIAGPASPSPASVEFIGSRLAQMKVPGFASCVVRAGEIAWCGGFGLARLRSGTKKAAKVTKDTSFLLASVSKTIVATAFMALVDSGVVTLQQPINDNPAGVNIALPKDSGQQPIRYIDLLTHTAGIADNWSKMTLWYSDGSDSTIALKDIVAGYFLPGAKWYDANANFTGNGPAIAWQYANMGTTLLGYLIESWVKQDFGQHCKATIFAPLGMKHTSWYLADFADPDAQLAMPYTYKQGKFQPTGHYTFADYPSGALRSSAHDMARFLQMYLAGGSAAGATILKAQTVELMTKPAVAKIKSDQAIQWNRQSIDGQIWISHGGSESGVTTDLQFNPTTGIGVVLLFNGKWSGAQANTSFSEIRKHVLAQAALSQGQ
ncbi:MAG TPA: hypothetical protein DCQ06_10125 [Myxococcales bacterium]|nr:hypothetical protein [Myxococcales bacterium]HAN31941.1 hypothetical protein [Myxococcales bacterium]